MLRPSSGLVADRNALVRSFDAQWLRRRSLFFVLRGLRPQSIKSDDVHAMPYLHLLLADYYPKRLDRCARSLGETHPRTCFLSFPRLIRFLQRCTHVHIPRNSHFGVVMACMGPARR